MGMDPLTMSPLMMAAGAGGSLAAVSAVKAPQAAKQQLALQQSRDDLALAQQRQAKQDALQKTLASQANHFAAAGADPASGSALSLAQSAESDTTRALSLLDMGSLLAKQQRALSRDPTAETRSLLRLGSQGLQGWI